MKKRLIIGLLILSLFCLAPVSATQALEINDILKVGGIPVLVSKFSTPLNNFINNLTDKSGVGTKYSTKVVPILSLGGGGYIGAAQVIGQESLVKKTKAVMQIESNFNGKNFRVKALVPVDSTNPTDVSRVKGVGVSAIIDIKI